MSATLAPDRPRIARSRHVDSTRKERLRSILTIAWLIAAGAVLVVGVDYYAAAPFDRSNRPDHSLFGPSGALGRVYGVVGFLIAALGVALYSIRTRTRWLAGFGTLRSWLYVHTFLCSLGAVLVLFHTGLRWSGLAGVATTAVVLTLISGVYGRFLYQGIPRSPHGRFLTPDEMDDERRRLQSEVMEVARCSPEQAGVWLGAPLRTDHSSPLRAIGLSLRHRITRRFQKMRLSRVLADAGLKGQRNTEVVRLLLADRGLQGQMAMRVPFQLMFGRWKWVHIRLTLAAGCVVLVQVAVAWSRSGG